MKRIAWVGIGVATAIRLGALDAARAALGFVKEAVHAAFAWHRRRLMIDPSYPVAITAIAKAVVSIAIPRAAVAGALIALVIELLGASPFRGFSEPEDGWDGFGY